MLITQSNREFYNTYKDNYNHIISIICPTDDLKPLHDNHKIFKMWDIDKVLKNNFREYNPPGLKDCMSILSVATNWYFDEQVKKENYNLLIHCDAGVSRSSALALGILWNITAYFYQDINQVPNILIKKYIDLRKESCINILSDNSTQLKRYIIGRYNPSVKPNQAILNHFRNALSGFPW